MSNLTIPVDARRADWPRLVSQAFTRLAQRQEECCAGGGSSLELDGGDAGGSDGSFAIDGGGA